MIDYLNNHTVGFSIDILVSMWFVFIWLLTGFLVTAFLWIDADLHRWESFKEILTPYAAPRVFLLVAVCTLFPPLAIWVAWNEGSVRKFRAKICNKITKKFGG